MRRSVLVPASVTALCLAVGFSSMPQVSGQSGTADWEEATGGKMSFEVASIKPNHSAWGGMSSSFGSPSITQHFFANDVTAKWLIVMAYDIKVFQLSEAPAWTASHRYDVEANIGDSDFLRMRSRSREEQMHEVSAMLQTLLAERFGLKVTHQTKMLPVYSLVLAKDDSKLKALAVTPYSVVKDGNVGAGSDKGQSEVDAHRATLAVFANGLSILLGAPVTDETAVKGTYTFSIRWTDASQLPDGSTVDPAFDRSLAAALDEVAGLKLESLKAPFDTIHVDHIEEPSPN